MAEMLTHIDESGAVRMVDVSAKPDTERVAVAEGFIAMHPETLALIVEGKAAKGDVLACARVAGVMGAKQTSSLIPMCHPLRLTAVDIAFTLEEAAVHIRSKVKCKGETGVEMEALTAVSAAALTIYDMCKAVQRDMEITDIRLCRKSGGKTGDYAKEW